MAKIHKIYKDGEHILPLTVMEAVIDSVSGESLKSNISNITTQLNFSGNRKLSSTELGFKMGDLNLTGVEVSAASRIVSDFIESDNVIITGELLAYIRIAEYDSNGVYIERSDNKPLPYVKKHSKIRIAIGTTTSGVIKPLADKIKVFVRNNVDGSNIKDNSIPQTKIEGEIKPDNLSNKGVFNTGIKRYHHTTFRVSESATAGTYPVPSTTWASSAIVKVAKGEHIYMDAINGIGYRFAYFNKDGSWISTDPQASVTYTDDAGIILEAPDEDLYVRVVLRYRTSAGMGSMVDSYMATFNEAVKISSSVLDDLAEGGYSEITTPLILEAGGMVHRLGTALPPQGLISLATEELTDEAFKTSQRTGKYLKVKKGTPISITFDKGTAKMFEYTDDYVFLGENPIESNKPYNLSDVVGMVKFAFVGQEPYAVLDYTVTLTVKDKNPEWLYNSFGRNSPLYDNLNFLYEADVSSGRDIMAIDDMSTEQYSKIKHYNMGHLKLPPNYNPKGEKVKLVIFVHGSGDMNSMNNGTFGASYENYFRYIQDEGYAMVDIFHGVTDKGNCGSTGNPTTYAAYASAYKWVTKNFNICPKGVFVSGKSSGGFMSFGMAFNKGIPVIAVGSLAPTFTTFHPFISTREIMRKNYAKEFGFEGDDSLLEGTALPPNTPEFKAYARLNAPKTIGYCTQWDGLVGADMEELLDIMIDRDMGNYERVKHLVRVSHVPIKSWIAEDDEIGLYQINRAYIKSLKNGMSIAELRTMPNGTGGHHAVDNSPLALKVDSITTRLGIIHENVPLAYVELIEWFRRFE